MSKQAYHIRNLTGITFKTVDIQDFSSRRYSDDFSNKFLSKRIFTSGDYTTKTDSSILSLLKQRKDTNESCQITSGTVSNVVKNYILPMFKKELKSKLSKKRKKELGLTNSINKSFDTKEGTVYAELKLSEKLGIENMQILCKIKDLEEKVNSGYAEKNAMEKEICMVRNELFNAQSMIKCLGSLNSCKDANSYYLEQNHLIIKGKYEKYKMLYRDSEKKNEELMRNLQEERAINDIRYIICFFLNSNK
ncbi:hypothetical protein SteCoe_15111 [Stentor coeruleus]|uniref:Uncharacterized protein n=1 Tax=Stentor coeruleus TaxID=5963 RepID=A0A1R2C4D4_9CILI|nr:hypothetical protein SteCoe_15111 [Stentor coeruleus]